MRGELDYPQSLRQRVALLKRLDAGALERVYDERLRLSPGADTMIEIAGGKLTGRITSDIVDAESKRTTLLHARDELGLGKDEIVALGDGANDLKFMAEAGVSVAYHAKPVVRAQATCALNYCGLEAVLNLFS